jgi:type II secretory pathway pseudopilin PulG
MTRGFTLFETLIYIAIIGMVMVSFVSFSMSISDSRNETYTVSEVQANARLSISIINQKIRGAAGVVTARSIFDTDPGYLYLTVASSTLNPTIIGLNQDDGILGIKEGSNATSSITSDEVKVTNLVFTNLTNLATVENIRTQITIGYISTSSPQFNHSQSVQSATSLRQ